MAELESAYADRRNELFERARNLIRTDPAGFTEAGRKLSELFPAERAIEIPQSDDPEDGIARFSVFQRIASAASVAANPALGDQVQRGWFEFNNFRDGTEKQLSARLITLAILLGSDDHANEVITPEMCELGTLPYETDDGSELGRIGVDWTERDWEQRDDPSPRVLNWLERAIHYASMHPSIQANARHSRKTSNPLLTDPVIHPNLKALFDGLVMVWVRSESVADCYAKMVKLNESGPPEPEDWPDSPGHRRRQANHAAWAERTLAEHKQRGEEVTVADPIESAWTEAMLEWREAYMRWCEALARAKDATGSLPLAKSMDAGETKPLARWTTRTRSELDALAGVWHPIRVGSDGLGIVRAGLPPLPSELSECMAAVRNRVAELRSIPVVDAPNESGVDQAWLDEAYLTIHAPQPDLSSESGLSLSGPTIGDLTGRAGISTDTFRRVRTLAGIVVHERGGAARKRRYSPEEVDRLIRAAEAGDFLERRRMVEKWAQWGTNQVRK